MKNQNKLEAKQATKGGNVSIITEVRGAKKTIMSILGVLAIVALMAIPFLGKVIAGKMAALYLLGNDGKISGRTSGDVYQRNGVKRGFKVPAYVNNAYTSSVRAIFSTASSAWRTLTSLQVAAWNAYTGTTSDRFGRMVTLKGKTIFVRINSNLRNSGQVAIVDPPLTGIAPTNMHVAAVTTGIGATLLDLSYTVDATHKFTVVMATSPMSIGITKPGKSKFRTIAIVDGTVASPADLWPAYTAKWGVPSVGMQSFFKIHVIGVGTGLASPRDITPFLWAA